MSRWTRLHGLTSVGFGIALVAAAGCSSSRSATPADSSLPIATTTTVVDLTSTTSTVVTTVADVATSVVASTSTTATPATVAVATVPAATFPAATVPLPTSPPPVAPDTTVPGATIAPTAPPAGGTGRYVTNPADNVRLGDTGPAVQQIQQRLVVYDFFVPVDGVFGQSTKDAVIAFQRNNALSADGVVGKNTWGLLKSDPEGGDF